MIYDYVSENKKLFRDVTNFAVHKLGITVDRFKQNFLMCPSHNFRRKTIEKNLTHWFYLEIHKIMDISGWTPPADRYTEHPTPPEFHWSSSVMAQKKEEDEKNKKSEKNVSKNNNSATDDDDSSSDDEA